MSGVGRTVRTLLVFLVLFAFSTLVTTGFCVVSESEARSKIEEAEGAVGSAYVAVAEAERVGANVSELLFEVEVAGNLLAEANNFYRVGDYDRAYSCAMNCSQMVNGIVSEASGLKLEAEDDFRERLLAAVGVSSAVLSVLFVLSLFGWRFLRERYLKRVLGMRPEVGEAE